MKCSAEDACAGDDYEQGQGFATCVGQQLGVVSEITLRALFAFYPDGTRHGHQDVLGDMFPSVLDCEEYF